MFNNQNGQSNGAADSFQFNPIGQPGSGSDANQSFNPTPAADQSASNGPADDLLGIKQQALQNLTPLVDKLEQSPEEKFKTTMMLIQASDNAGLIKRAYEAASQIEDEKARAQALIDIINEINYFTHQAPKPGS
jgi:hypothetical protein